MPIRNTRRSRQMADVIQTSARLAGIVAVLDEAATALALAIRTLEASACLNSCQYSG